ncbi:hypothetical protein DFH06DRAFT_1485552 [Mycena polygramma]|nr:hypothetical protein DFH06DRAFT_1485552 [Mycena polygramma]
MADLCSPRLRSQLLRSQLEQVRSAIVQQKCKHKKRIDALEKKQGELERHLAHIVYPVLTLPQDIVSRCFVACVQAEPPDCLGRMPRILTQVCRQWQEIAFSSSELWTWVRLDMPFGSQHECHTELSVLAAWFGLAQKRPLSVTLYSKLDLPKPIISLLVVVGEQLQSLSLPITLENFQALARDGIEFPNLLHLELGIVTLIHPPWEQAPLPIVTPLEQAPLTPRLRCLTLHRLSLSAFTLPTLRMLALDFEDHDEVDFVPSFITRSSCDLEHLSLPSHHHTKIIACLQAAPSLTSLDVEIDDLYAFTQTMSMDPLLLPLLRNLSLHLDPEVLSYPDLIQFLRSRLSRPTRLNSVTLKLTSFSSFGYIRPMGDAEWFPRSAKAEFQQLIAQGLIVEVFCEGKYYWPEKHLDEVIDYPRRFQTQPVLESYYS